MTEKTDAVANNAIAKEHRFPVGLVLVLGYALPAAALAARAGGETLGLLAGATTALAVAVTLKVFRFERMRLVTVALVALPLCVIGAIAGDAVASVFVTAVGVVLLFTAHKLDGGGFDTGVLREIKDALARSEKQDKEHQPTPWHWAGPNQWLFGGGPYHWNLPIDRRDD